MRQIQQHLYAELEHGGYGGSWDARVRGFSRRLGVSPASVRNWMSGRKRPSARNLRRLAEALSVRADELLGANPARPLYGELVWHDFLAAYGDELSEFEKEVLSSVRFPARGVPPTVEVYVAMWAAIRLLK